MNCLRVSQHVRVRLTRRSVQQLHLSQLLATSIAANIRCRALKTNDAETQKLRASSVGSLAKLLPTGSRAWFVNTSTCSCYCPAPGCLSGPNHVYPTFIWHRSFPNSPDHVSYFRESLLRHCFAAHTHHHFTKVAASALSKYIAALAEDAHDS